jgi:ubiquinone/menaquinone biosynthesis C-methylase UbiE
MKHNKGDNLHWQSIDYDEVSEVYDQARSGSPEMIQHLVRGVSLGPKSLALDVGCGTANNTLCFAETTNAQVVGIDLSRWMLRKAQEKAPGLRFIQSSAELLPFLDSVFGFVFMTDVVHHLPDLVSTLSEVHRVLNRGGLVCIVTQSQKQIEERMTSKFFPTTAAIDKARYPSISEIEKAMLDLGYIHVHSDEHTLAPFVLGPDYLAIVEKKGYSSLYKIGNEEFREGLRAIRDALSRADELRYFTEYTFVWAAKGA